MLPVDMQNNPTDRRLSNTESVRDGLLRATGCAKAADLGDVLCGQLCRVYFFAMRLAGATLGATVVSIVLLRSEKQMVGAKAGRIVAFVKHAKSLGYRAYRQLVGDPVNLLASSLKFDLSVSTADFGTRPFHAGVVIRGGFEQRFQQRIIANLVSHLSALLKRGCMALAVFAHRGAFPILAPRGAQST